jgi:hypothetical protein
MIISGASVLKVIDDMGEKKQELVVYYLGESSESVKKRRKN